MNVSLFPKERGTQSTPSDCLAIRPAEPVKLLKVAYVGAHLLPRNPPGGRLGRFILSHTDVEAPANQRPLRALRRRSGT